MSPTVPTKTAASGSTDAERRAQVPRSIAAVLDVLRQQQRALEAGGTT